MAAMRKMRRHAKFWQRRDGREPAKLRPEAWRRKVEWLWWHAEEEHRLEYLAQESRGRRRC
jgi:hypothetical protein